MASKDFTDGYAARVKQARNDADLTQEQISAILGIDRGNYKQYEKRSKLPHKYIEKFCEATGADPEWLLTGKSPVDNLTPAQRRWLSIIENASPKKLKQLEAVIKSLQD